MNQQNERYLGYYPMEERLAAAKLFGYRVAFELTLVIRIEWFSSR